LKKYIYLGLFILAAVAGAALFFKSQKAHWSGQEVEIDWRLLGEMDYVTGKSSAELKNMDGRMVRMPGFMVPLEDSMRVITEFLLVPSPQACIHVPPPPPNQMILVKMDKKLNTTMANGPIWLYGVFHIVTKQTVYGDSSFEIQGVKIEPYK
jgi:hypothetical protein